MEKPKILVTGIVSREGLTALFEKYDVSYSEEEYTREWVLEHIKAYDGLLLMGMKADRELIDRAEKLQVISVNGVGFDHVDVRYAAEKGIIVSNSPQSVRVPTAEMTFALLLAAAKRLYFYDSVVRSGEWMDVSKQEYQGMTLAGNILGIFGMGRIGKTVAAYARCFGMKVIYNDLYRLPKEQEIEAGIQYVEFDQLLEQSDIVSIHAPLVDSTRHAFDKAAFAKMKQTACIINAARGAIIEEAALVNALENKEIAGAGLDVFEFEPQVSEKLRALPNVILSPHAGTGTVGGRREIAKEAAANLLAYFSGKPVHVVRVDG